MRIFLNRYLLSGLAVLAVSHQAFGADMDNVLFSEPIRYGPGITEPVYYDNALTGFVEGSFAYGKGEFAGSSADGNRWALRGSINGKLSPNWNVQIDGLYSRMSVDPVDVDTLAGAAHAYYRSPTGFAIGGFVQGSRFGSNVLNALTAIGGDKYATDIIGGGEAAYFTNLATFYGQIGFGQASYSGFDVDHLLAKVGTRLYATDNVRLDLEGSLNRFSGFGGHADLYSFSAIGNYRLPQVPVTLFAGYQYDKATAPELTSEDVTVNTFLAGLRFSFGSNSLKEEERNGPIWSISAPNL